MKALVTGANGFIGTHLVEVLRLSGWEVRCLVHRSASELQTLNVDCVFGDVCQPETLPAAVEQTEVVFHLAGVTKAANLRGYLEVNEQGTAHLLEAAARHAPQLRRFVLVSSLAAAGPSPDGRPLTEEDPPRPISAYGLSKLRAEEAAHRYADRLPITIVRPPAVYGPRERDLLVYFRQVQRGLLLQPPGSDRYLSIIYVADLNRGILRAASSKHAVGQTYFLSNREPVTWRQLGALIAESLGARPLSITVPMPLVEAAGLLADAVTWITRRPLVLSRDKVQEMKQRYWVCDPSKAERELGFRAEIPLEEGIKETADWYRRNGWLS